MILMLVEEDLGKLQEFFWMLGCRGVLVRTAFAGFSTKPVRSCTWFRQVLPFFLQTCLKLTLLRTAFPRSPSNLSEVDSSSDNFSWFSIKPV